MFWDDKGADRGIVAPYETVVNRIAVIQLIEV